MGISERKDTELKLITMQVENLERKCKEIECRNEQQKINMATHIIDLGQKENMIKSARSKLVSQQELIKKQQELEKANAAELEEALETIQQLRNRLEEQNELISKMS